MAIHPPQGNQKTYKENAQVYGEQYHAGGAWPVGAIAEAGPQYPASGGPYVVTLSGIWSVRDTDWVVSSRRTGTAIAVLTNEEFGERYTGPGGP